MNDAEPVPDLPGIRAAVRYRATGVGGHCWYDLVPLPGGRVLLVLGEVVTSPDVPLAIDILRQQVLTMGAALDMPPDDVLAHAGDVAVRLGQRLGGAVTATCLLAVIDPTTGRCTIASAGHDPPTLLPSGQPPCALKMPVGDPLGDPLGAQATNRDDLSGSVLLVANEAAGDPADVATRYLRLAPLAAAGASGPWLEGLCDAIEAGAQGGDLALLALAFGRLDDSRIGAWRLQRVPESAAIARGHAAEMLGAWQLAELSDTVQLLVSELVGNCVRHARGLRSAASDPAPGHVWLRMLRLNDVVVCEVYDGSAAVPRVRHPRLDDEFGRGLQLVALTSSSWGTRYTRLGKCVWAAVDVPAPPGARR